MKAEINHNVFIDLVLAEIRNNVENGDMTAIQELIEGIDTKKLMGFLPEEFTKRIEVKAKPVKKTEFNDADVECLKVTHVQVFVLTEPVGKTRAMARVVLNDQIQLTGLRIVDGATGLFVAYPNDPNYKGDDYRSLFYPVTKALREHIEEEVIKSYGIALGDAKPTKTTKKKK